MVMIQNEKKFVLTHIIMKEFSHQVCEKQMFCMSYHVTDVHYTWNKGVIYSHFLILYVFILELIIKIG